LSKSTLLSLLDPLFSHPFDNFTFTSHLEGEGPVTMVLLTATLSIRLDDFISGIPLAQALYESFQGSCVDQTTAKKNFGNYAQRILFDHNLLGACTDPWSVLLPTITRGKRIRHHAYFQERLDGSVRLLKLLWAHLEAHLPSTPAQKKARKRPLLHQVAWDYVKKKSNSSCEFREHMERMCVDVRTEVRSFLLETIFGKPFLTVYRLRKELCLSGVGFSYQGLSHPMPQRRRENIGWLERVVPEFFHPPPTIWPEQIPSHFNLPTVNPCLPSHSLSAAPCARIQKTEDNWVILQHDVASKTTINLDENGRVTGHSYPHFINIDGSPGSNEQWANSKKHAQFIKKVIEEEREKLFEAGEDPYSVHFPMPQTAEEVGRVPHYFTETRFYGRHSSQKVPTRRRTKSCHSISRHGLGTACILPSEPDLAFRTLLASQLEPAERTLILKKLLISTGVDKKAYRPPLIYGGQKSFAPTFKKSELSDAFEGADKPERSIPSRFLGRDPPVSFVSQARAETGK